MARARILYQSRADGITLSATSEARAVANLQNPDVQNVWRSTDATQQVISGDFGAAYVINLLYLENINALADTEYLIQLSTDNFATISYSATFNKITKDLAYKSAIHWFGDTGGGEVVDGDGDSLVDSGGDSLVAGTWSTPPTGRYFRLTIVDPSNTDGYIEIGRLMIGKYFDAPNSQNIAEGPTLSYVENGELVTMRGGGMLAEQKTPARQVDVVYEDAHEDDSYDIDAASFSEILEYAGHRKDIFYSAFPQEGTDRERRYALLGRIINQPGLTTHFQSGVNSARTAWQRLPLSIRESL